MTQNTIDTPTVAPAIQTAATAPQPADVQPVKGDAAKVEAPKVDEKK